MMKLALGLASALALPLLALAACATDNGAPAYGDQYAPPGSKLDAGNDAAPVPGDDSGSGEDGSDGATDGDAQTPACSGTGTIAVLAGDDSSLSGALQVNGAAWGGGAIASGASKSLPALVPFGSGFAGMTRGPSDALQSIVVGAAFGTPAQVGSATTLDSPALAVVGTTAHVAYLDSSYKFLHGANAGSTWDSATDKVQPAADAGAQAFGPSAPALAAAGSDLVFAQVGNNSGVYALTYAGSWSPSVEIAAGGAAYGPAPPSLVALPGASDLALVYVNASNQVAWVLRDGSGKAWGNPGVVNASAWSNEQPSVARLSATTLLLAFRGQDHNAYVSTGTYAAAAVAGGGTLTWTAPAPLVAGGVSVDSAPAVAKGVCGDDAVVVFASSSQVKATRLRGATWSTPEVVTGAAGKRVAVATR